jgi:hypothetical protein
MTTRLSLYLCVSLFLAPSLLLASGFRLSEDNLKKEVATVNEILRKEHQIRNITPPQKLPVSMLVRRVYLTAAGRIPSFTEIDALEPFDQQELKISLIDRLLLSKAYESQMFNWWADHLRAKTYVMGQANQVGVGFLYVDWLKSQVSKNVPFDELARSVIASEGYPWENGAVGYYLRDDGMPLENMSNTAELFLGTQLVCAQCHNHPFDKWTQMEYYQMAAHTYGVVTRMQGGISSDLYKLAKVKSQEMNGMQMSSMMAKGDTKQKRAFRQSVQDMLLPLQFGAKHKDRKLKLPHDYKYDDAKPKQVVGPGKIFSLTDNQEGEPGLVQQYAKWMTSPENPRFTRVIVNRMWKKIFGIGLVEPTNDWKDDTVASIPPLLDHLSDLMVRLDYDLREFQRVLMNLEIFEREAYDKEIEPGKPYYFPAPTLTRMSAEQLWDSILSIFVPDLDNRTVQYENDFLSRKKKNFDKYLEKVQNLSTEELLNLVLEGQEITLSIQQEINELSAKIKEASREDNRKGLGELKGRLNKKRDQQRTAIAQLIMGEDFNVTPMYKNFAPKPKRPLTHEEKIFPHHLRRASEHISPTGADHFLREFGQSDRNLIENGRRDASVPQALNLLNNNMRNRLSDKNSVLGKKVMSLQTVEAKIQAIYLGTLQRPPTNEELSLCKQTFEFPDPAVLQKPNLQNNTKKDAKMLKDWEKRKQHYYNKVHDELRHLAWALLNTREFSFIQ